jgi:hypothetical protein
MRVLLALLVCAAVVVAFSGVSAAEEKEQTLKGSLVCGKCTLKICDKCTNVLQVKDGTKTLDYFLDDEGAKAPYHKDICPKDKRKDATVVGVVSEKEGKKFVKPSKVDLK